MAKVIIGGQPVEGHLDTFDRLERAWPHIEAVQAAFEGQAFMQAMSAMVEVIAVATDRDPAELKRTLKTSEFQGLRPFFNDLLVQSGAYQPGEGEAAPDAPAAGEAKAEPSTETSTASSPNS